MTAARVDTNQAQIVATLRGMGCTVQHLHAVGAGCPDLLVGCRGVNLLFEVKSENGQLNAGQIVWHNYWQGSVQVVRTSEQAAAIVTDVWQLTARLRTPQSHNRWSKHKTTDA